ncbi:MAG: LiaF transmembrane domain-containing protein [Methanomassiliicoccales archaeon]
MRVGRFIFALLLVVAGVMAFLINMGYGSWASYVLIGQWWPLLLIIVGLAMFWQGRIPQALAYILVVVVVAGVVGYMMTNNQAVTLDMPAGSSQKSQELTVRKSEHAGLKSGQLTLNFGGGRLDLASGTGQWLEGRITGGLREKLVQVENDRLKIVLRAAEPQDFWPRGENEWAKDREWNLKLAPELNWVINANIGAVAADMDLSNIGLSHLDCNLGAGALNITLGNNGPLSRLDISGGASSIKIRIPQGTGVRVVKGAALTSDNLDELGWSRNGNAYTSPNYEQAANRVDMEFHLGAGAFEIQQY